MSVLRFATVSLGALTLAACGAASEPDAAPVEDAATTEAGADTAAEPGPDTASAPEPAPATQADGLHPLEITAREVCEAGDESFAAPLPAETGFASRGPDARVHVAWNYQGETAEHIIETIRLTQDQRLAFDGVVADFLRRNLVRGVDRRGLTGAFRFRDGRFCVVQTEAEVIEPLQEATAIALEQLAAAQ